MEKKLLKLCVNYFIIAILSVLIYSCSTQKDKFLNRSYHKTTSKFNGYFNGKESLKEAISKLEKTHQEDYNNLLPTAILGDQKQAQKIYPQLNRTIDKASLVIERHSMEIRGKEFKNALNDGRLAHAFLLTGIRGVGKTTTARIIAKAFNCEGNNNKEPTFKICNNCEPCKSITNGDCLDVIELDAASKTGVENIREIIDSVMYVPNEARLKIYIIDNFRHTI